MRTTLDILSRIEQFVSHISLILNCENLLTNSVIKMAKRFTRPNSNWTRFVLWVKIVFHKWGGRNPTSAWCELTGRIYPHLDTAWLANTNALCTGQDNVLWDFGRRFTLSCQQRVFWSLSNASFYQAISRHEKLQLLQQKHRFTKRYPQSCLKLNWMSSLTPHTNLRSTRNHASI